MIIIILIITATLWKFCSKFFFCSQSSNGSVATVISTYNKIFIIKIKNQEQTCGYGSGPQHVLVVAEGLYKVVVIVRILGEVGGAWDGIEITCVKR